ncbi:MAG: MerR family transcriptional regulator [Anaerolineae bacterium]|nr:MerR family transcriptional regulator [Anaerolineae bacterium]
MLPHVATVVILAVMYTSLQVAAIFGLSRETIRRYADEFKDHLSPSANPSPNRARSFNDADLAVVALVSELKRLGKQFDEIHAALSNGQRGAPPENARSIVLSDQPKVTTLQSRVNRLEQELSAALDNAKHLEGRIEELSRQLEATKRDLREAYKEIGRMER